MTFGVNGCKDTTQIEHAGHAYTGVISEQSDGNQNVAKPIDSIYDNRIESSPPVYDNHIDCRPSSKEDLNGPSKDQQDAEYGILADAHTPAPTPAAESQEEYGTLADAYTPEPPEYVTLSNDYLQEDEDDAADPVYFKLERAESLQETEKYEEANVSVTNTDAPKGSENYEEPTISGNGAPKEATGGDGNGGSDNYGYLDTEEVNGQYDTLQRTAVPSANNEQYDTLQRTVVASGVANGKTSVQVKQMPTINENAYGQLSA